MSETGFGELLRHYRIAAGLTQEELAERSGLSTRGTSDLERGARRLPRKDTLELLLRGQELPPADQMALVSAARRPLPTRSQWNNSDGAPSLPLAPTSLVGREREVTTARELMLWPEVCILTLIGPGNRRESPG